MTCHYSGTATVKVRPELKDDFVDRCCDELRDAIDADVTQDGLTITFTFGDSYAWGGVGEVDMSIQNFIDDIAADYVVLRGEFEGEHYEQLLVPSHIDETEATIRWKREQIAKLEAEIAALADKQYADFVAKADVTAIVTDKGNDA